MAAIVAALGALGGAAARPTEAATGLTATAVSTTEINLSWSFVPDGGPVYLRRCEGAGCDVYNATVIASNLANPGSYQDNGLTPGTSYSYLVVGSDGYYGATATTLSLPTSKEQCLKGGWQNYGGIFKNQGDCVSYVASKGRNQPG